MISLIKKFAKLYLVEEPIVDKKYNEGCRISYNKGQEDYEEGSYYFYDDYVYKNIEDYNYNNEGNINAIIINSNKPPEYKLPVDFEIFCRMFPNGVIFKSEIFLSDNNKPAVKFCKEMEHTTLDITYICEFVENHPDLNILYLDEWVRILTDINSSCNSQGSLCMNICPSSKYYGKLIFYTSCDDGIGKIMPYEFKEFLEIAINEYEYFKNLGYKNKSFVDQFNFNNDDDNCWFKNYNISKKFIKIANKIQTKNILYKKI